MQTSAVTKGPNVSPGPAKAKGAKPDPKASRRGYRGQAVTLNTDNLDHVLVKDLDGSRAHVIDATLHLDFALLHHVSSELVLGGKRLFDG